MLSATGDILGITGIIETIIVASGFIYAIVLWAMGISPAMLRLGNGLAKRKIAVFANSNNMVGLERLLLDSGLFKQKNIYKIASHKDIGVAESATLFLVFWHDWADCIDEILNKKPDACALIVYAPRDLSPLSNEQMRKIDGHRHTSVTNFRGRLLNDIVTAMITTSYEKR